jgi:prevent-host-death family protein
METPNRKECLMAKRVSAREARAHFAEITDRVRYTGEPVIVEKQGKPSVALVSLSDFDILERLRRQKAAGDFARLAGQAAREAGGPEPSEEEIVESVKRAREELYRERYGKR